MKYSVSKERFVILPELIEMAASAVRIVNAAMLTVAVVPASVAVNGLVSGR